MTPTVASSKPRPPKDDIDIAKLLFLALSRWYLFALALAIALCCAWIYNRYTRPVYRVSATLFIKEPQASPLPGIDGYTSTSSYWYPNQNVDNQTIILQSYTLIRRALSELSFSPECYERGRILSSSLYPEYPVIITPVHPDSIPYDVEFSLVPQGDSLFRITVRDNGDPALDREAAFGETIRYRNGSFTIFPHPGHWKNVSKEREIYFVFHHTESLVASFRSRLKVEAATREGTILRVSLQGTNKYMDRDFLDKLLEVYLDDNLEKKNREASRIMQFIDEQLVGIADSLDVAGTRLEEFRSRHRVMDLSAEGQQIIQQALTLEDERARLQVASRYYSYLDKYLAGGLTEEAPITPSTMGINDPLLSNLVQELAELQAQYQMAGMGERNPMQVQLAQRITALKMSMRENIKGVIQANRLAASENWKRRQQLNKRAEVLPATERRLLGIERQYKLNDALYTFLLEKRAEASIQKAANAPDHELVDVARIDGAPVAPRKRNNYLIALVFGLCVPMLWIYLSDLLGTRVTSEDDIRNLTDLPVSGHIMHNDKGVQNVVLAYPQGPVAEAFRGLRTRLQFFTRDKKSIVILVTSSMKEEGKTFTALNLASAYSLAEKKTVLVTFDLRRPKVFSEFKLDNGKGVSTWLIGKDALEDIISSTKYPNLDMIPSGPVPPNPGELTASEKTRELLDLLRQRYDYIILDSAPIGTVSDSYPLALMADASLILVRHGLTPKRLLSATLAEAKAIGIPHISILINDLKPGGAMYGYRYSYGYGYGYIDGE